MVILRHVRAIAVDAHSVNIEVTHSLIIHLVYSQSY